MMPHSVVGKTLDRCRGVVAGLLLQGLVTRPGELLPVLAKVSLALAQLVPRDGKFQGVEDSPWYSIGEPHHVVIRC